MGCQQCHDENRARKCDRTRQELYDDYKDKVWLLTDTNGLCAGSYSCGHEIQAHTNRTTEPQGAAGTRHPLPLRADGRSVEDQLQDYGLPVRSREQRLTYPQLIGGGSDFPPQNDKLSSCVGTCCTVFSAWYTTFCHQSSRNKEHTPAPYLPASPGMGKTRLLQVLATPASDEADDINGRAKRDALAAFGGKEDSQRGKCARFCSAFEQAVGVYCTFNSGQEILSDHSPDSLGDSNVSLAARLYYAYWIDMGHTDFATFCSRFVWEGITVGPVVQAIRTDINDQDRPLVICVDEVMLWGGTSGAERDERITNCIKAIVELPVHHPHVYTVVSSLEPEAVRHGVIGTNRTPVAALLSPVDNSYASQLLSPLVDGGVQNWLAAHLEVLIQDCGGSPRLLEHLAKVLQGWKGETRLEQLSQVLTSVSAISNFQSKFLLDTETGMRQLFQALSLAVRGQRVPVQILGELSMAGVISQSFNEDAIPWIPPLYLMLFQTALDRRSKTGLARTTSTILRWFRSYLAYDQLPPNEYIATNLEVQFAFAWGMRCRVLFSSDSKGQPTTETVKNVSLSEVLVSDEQQDKVNRHILVLCKTSSEDNDGPPFRKMDTQEFCSESAQIPPGVMILPTNPNNAGYDLMAVYKTPKDEQFAIVVQVKYSGPESSTTLSNSLVVESVRNTVKHHPYLHGFIDSGRFLFVFAAHRPANINVSIDGCLKEAAKKGKGKGKGREETEKLVSAVVHKHLHLMLQSDIERFLGPTLYARPQFWSPERTAQPLKKQKTK